MKEKKVSEVWQFVAITVGCVLLLLVAVGIVLAVTDDPQPASVEASESFGKPRQGEVWSDDITVDGVTRTCWFWRAAETGYPYGGMSCDMQGAGRR